MNDKPTKVKFPEEPTQSPGRSPINEVEQLRKAVLLLCEAQREMMGKLDVLTQR